MVDYYSNIPNFNSDAETIDSSFVSAMLAEMIAGKKDCILYRTDLHKYTAGV